VRAFTIFEATFFTQGIYKNHRILTRIQRPHLLKPLPTYL